jgi:hypothetical protein
MLQQRNSYEGVNKLRVNRLTLPGRLTSLESTLAGSWLPRWASWLSVAMVAACAGMGGVNKDLPMSGSGGQGAVSGPLSVDQGVT